jgi:hypothetical protein
MCQLTYVNVASAFDLFKRGFYKLYLKIFICDTAKYKGVVFVWNICIYSLKYLEHVFINGLNIWFITLKFEETFVRNIGVCAQQ